MSRMYYDKGVNLIKYKNIIKIAKEEKKMVCVRG